MSDRDRPPDGTGELPPTEPMGRAGTEPLRPPVVPSTTRRPGSGIPRALVLIAVGILVAGLVVGFLLGRASGPDEPSDDAAMEDSRGQGQGGGGGGQGGGQEGGRRGRKASRACRRALSLSQQVVGAQDQLLANRAQVAEALLAEDAATIEELNAQSDELLSRITTFREDLDKQIRRCL
jgi:hypothetical protein